MDKKVSIVIIAKEYDKGTIQRIKYWKNQNYNKKEILLVTPNNKIKIKDVKIIKDLKKGPSYARNLGVKTSKGQIIVFSDSDENAKFINEKYFLSNIMYFFNNTNSVDYVLANYLPYLSNNTLRNIINIKDFGVSDALNHLPEAYNKKIIGNNPFSSKLEYGEDKYLFEKIKKKSKNFGIIKIPRLMDSNIISFKLFFKRYIWYGKTIKKYMEKSWDLKPIINMVVGMVCSLFFLNSIFLSIMLLFILYKYIKQKNIFIYCLKKKALLAWLLAPIISIFSYIIIGIFFIKSLFFKC
ncbi:MAG: glycosyltransferase family A protein [Candidatus Nanoarchaeia archaeon]|jgi:hypothetical protein